MPPLLNTSMPQAYIGTDENGKDIRYPLRLHDARAKQPNRKHQLAVCLQPIFLLADWTILIQFFETWIVQGATKFYIYIHSIAPEVDALLKVYEADRKIDVERVHWAPLPVRNGTSPNDDPNYLIYRTEVVTSVNDCVLRSRGHTKYVVSSDLDEIIVPFRNMSLMTLVDALKLGTPKAAAFIFLSSYALFQNDWAKAESPKAINFEEFSEVELEEYVWPNGKRSKVIMIPELIRSAHVHTVLHTERSSKIVVVSRKDALVFHLRRVLKRDKLSTNGTRTSNDLQRFVKPCNDLWNQRLKQIPQVPGTEILRQAKWPNRGLKVMEELEKCLVAEFARRSEMCTSPLKCINAIQAIQPKQWIWANQTWTVL